MREKNRNFSLLKTKKKFQKPEFSELFLGGDSRVRTGDLLNAIQALSQLSYTPMFCSAALLSHKQQGYYSSLAENVKHYFEIFSNIF